MTKINDVPGLDAERNDWQKKKKKISDSKNLTGFRGHWVDGNSDVFGLRNVDRYN